MALFTDISEDNRVETQFGTWKVSIRQTGAYTVTNTAQQTMTFLQYKAEASLTKSYSYVGIAKSSVEALAETIRSAYTNSRASSVVRWNREEGRWVYQTAANAWNVDADVTPVHMDGPMWKIDVSVNAAATFFFDRRSDTVQPTVTEVKGMMGNVDSFPEIPQSPQTEAN